MPQTRHGPLAERLQAMPRGWDMELDPVFVTHPGESNRERLLAEHASVQGSLGAGQSCFINWRMGRVEVQGGLSSDEAGPDSPQLHQLEAQRSAIDAQQEAAAEQMISLLQGQQSDVHPAMSAQLTQMASQMTALMEQNSRLQADVLRLSEAQLEEEQRREAAALEAQAVARAELEKRWEGSQTQQKPAETSSQPPSAEGPEARRILDLLEGKKTGETGASSSTAADSSSKPQTAEDLIAEVARELGKAPPTLSHPTSTTHSQSLTTTATPSEPKPVSVIQPFAPSAVQKIQSEPQLQDTVNLLLKKAPTSKTNQVPAPAPPRTRWTAESSMGPGWVEVTGLPRAVLGGAFLDEVSLGRQLLLYCGYHGHVDAFFLHLESFNVHAKASLRLRIKDAATQDVWELLEKGRCLRTTPMPPFGPLNILPGINPCHPTGLLHFQSHFQRQNRHEVDPSFVLRLQLLGKLKKTVHGVFGSAIPISRSVPSLIMHLSCESSLVG